MLDSHQVPLCAARKDRMINPIWETTLMERAEFSLHFVSVTRTKKDCNKATLWSWWKLGWKQQHTDTTSANKECDNERKTSGARRWPQHLAVQPGGNSGSYFSLLQNKNCVCRFAMWGSVRKASRISQSLETQFLCESTWELQLLFRIKYAVQELVIAVCWKAWYFIPSADGQGMVPLKHCDRRILRVNHLRPVWTASVLDCICISNLLWDLLHPDMQLKTKTASSLFILLLLFILLHLLHLKRTKLAAAAATSRWPHPDCETRVCKEREKEKRERKKLDTFYSLY